MLFSRLIIVLSGSDIPRRSYQSNLDIEDSLFITYTKLRISKV